jgi:hypothetical protein
MNPLWFPESQSSSIPICINPNLHQSQSSSIPVFINPNLHLHFTIISRNHIMIETALSPSDLSVVADSLVAVLEHVRRLDHSNIGTRILHAMEGLNRRLDDLSQRVDGLGQDMDTIETNLHAHIDGFYSLNPAFTAADACMPDE